MEKTVNRTIITVVGKDTVGIIASVCNYLAEEKVNIEDISQTIVQGFFNMMMIVDCKKGNKTLQEMSKDLSQLGDSIGVSIHCQKEEIFDMMHRL